IVAMLASRLDRLPHWLRFVATPRKDRAVLDSLRGLRARSLDAQDPRNLEDLDQYIRARCESPALRQRLAACHQSPELVCRILHDKSQGNFLYAQQTLQGIERDLYDVGRLDALPPGLAGLYQMFFARQYPDETAYVPIRRVLEVVLAAEEPPTCEMLAKATGLEGETELPAVLRRLSPYLPQCQTEGGERGYTLYHRSLANWLTNVDERGSLYYVSRARGHKALADACWADLQADSPNVSAYARAHLPAHLLALGDWERLLQVLATFREPSLMEEWVERGDELGAACLTNLINKGGLRSHHQAALAAQLARIHGNRGKYSDAEHWLRFALAHTSWWHGRRTRAVATHELGSLYLYRGDVTRAARCYRRALRLCMLGVPIYHDEVAANEVALATVALANVVLPGFRWSKVVRLARHAHREACSASNVPHALAAQRLLAIAFEHLGKYDASRAVCLSALEASHQAGADIERARLSSQAGYFFYRQAALHGQTYTQAREYSNQAVRIAEQIHHLYTMLDATLCLGGCALAEGQTEEAIKCFERVSSSLPPGRHRELLTAARLGLAAAAHQKGDTENARKGYQQAIALATEARGLPGLRMRSLIGLGAICWHDGDHREAEVFWQQARRCARRYSLLQQQMFNMNLRRCRMARNVPPL
ncbi:MAG: tetratricopeptide repeat protein, partial [Phycisphaerae bacterium]|nr:tetratricopeptide repeat protein [Phycisphaerae bacterium]